MFEARRLDSRVASKVDDLPLILASSIRSWELEVPAVDWGDSEGNTGDQVENGDGDDDDDDDDDEELA
ncbi:uncharacterized protein BP5553_03941 [Venustampulla echinocandica]|uniref:Uncharacterized protein n=1 Tax=Venustampulla echinocandica TaxID=2656787 RepID=A0A370TVP8_9HELO|nr:uncharacterized protein BP5553_03941 [Venustampulla echinocandica]RDL39601.1 hypothetical protein BP5553_03941 [Venustampulla echinocandica]